MAVKKSRPQIKTIWGLASQLGFDKETLYSIMERVTGKNSMRACSDYELNQIVFALGKYKDTQNKNNNMASKQQIWKIRQLEIKLKWDENPSRLVGFMKKYYQVERIEWLKSYQAHKLIESLKVMHEKKVNGEIDG